MIAPFSVCAYAGRRHDEAQGRERISVATTANDASGVGEEFSSGQLAGRYMGFGHLLRLWRKNARVTQPVAARALGMSERTYRKVEQGATFLRLTREQCAALASVLDLDRDERHALLLYNLGTSVEYTEEPELRKALQLLIDRQMPSPSYLTDRNWNILSFNRAMAEWWPWVMEPGANLLRWALTDPAARDQFEDWDMHAAAYVKIMKFAQATRDLPDSELEQLIAEVKSDPFVERLWEAGAELEESRDGHVFRMRVPALDWETVEVVSHVLHPASAPDCRFTVLTWVESAQTDDKTNSLGGQRNSWAQGSQLKRTELQTPA